MRERWLVCACALLILICGCVNWNEDKEAKPEDVCDGVVEAVFDITPGVNWVPFPFDYFTTPDPTSPVGLKLALGDYTPPMVRGVLNDLDFVKDALNALRGFGVHERILIPLAGDLDPSSLPEPADTLDKDSPIVVFPIAPDGTAGPLVPFFSKINRDLSSIELRPLVSWPAQTTLVVAVKQDLFDWSQRPLCPSGQFAYMIKREKDSSYPRSEMLEPMRIAYQPVLEAIEDLGIARGELAVAFWFTTQAPTKALHDARRYLDMREEAAPPFPSDITIEESPYPELAFIGRGHLDIPNFRDGDGVFWLDPSTGMPTPIQPDESVEFLFMMPNPDESDYPPPYPAVVIIHGAGVGKESFLPLASEIAHWGFAFFMIDLVEYGSRAACPLGVEQLCFFDFLHPLRMRDNIRQSVLDNVWLAKMVKGLDQLDLIPYTSPAEYGDGEPDLDTSHIFVGGHSLGAIVGTMVAAASPEIDVCLASSTGGYLTQIVRQHWILELILDIIGRFRDVEFPEEGETILDFYQAILDSADAANYIAQLSLEPEPDIDFLKDVLALESVGDYVIPNASAALYALHGDIPLVEPYVYEQPGLRTVDSPAEGWGIFQYDTPNHDLLASDDPLAAFARYQAGYFMRSRVTNDRAIIIDPFEAK